MGYFFFGCDVSHTILALKAGDEGLLRGLADPCIVTKGNETVLLLACIGFHHISVPADRSVG